MNTPVRWLIIILAIAAAGFGGFWIGRDHPSAAKEGDPKEAATTEPAAEEKPVVEVTTATLKTGPIEEIVNAYGTVVAQAGDVRILSVPFESRVTKLLVTAGEQVAAGTEIVQIEPSADAQVALQEARNGLGAAERDLKQTQARFNDHLATNTRALLGYEPGKALAEHVVSAACHLGDARRLELEGSGAVFGVPSVDGRDRAHIGGRAGPDQQAGGGAGGSHRDRVYNARFSVTVVCQSSQKRQLISRHRIRQRELQSIRRPVRDAGTADF